MTGNDDNRVRLGELVKQRRKAQRMSQADLAQISGLGEASIGRIEAGQAPTSMRVSTKLALENALKTRNEWVDRVLEGNPTEDDLDPNYRVGRPGAHADLGGLSAGDSSGARPVTASAGVGEVVVEGLPVRAEIRRPLVAVLTELIAHLGSRPGLDEDEQALLWAAYRVLPRYWTVAPDEAKLAARSEWYTRETEDTEPGGGDS